MTVDLEAAFSTYLEEIDRCTTARCYWSLLHLLVTIPDVCAALESDNGDTSDGKYRNWCKRYFLLPGGGEDKTFTAKDRYALRCAVLRQGRTVPDRGQYSSYSFVQPTPGGGVFHRIVHDYGPGIGANFTLDVGQMARETVAAMHSWFADLQTTENARRLRNVTQHIRWLARKGEKVMPGITGVMLPTTSSTGGFMPPSP